MKKYVKATEMSNSLRNWLASDEVEELMKKMSRSEKRIIGKIANAKEVEGYVQGICDMLDMYELNVSDAFDLFLNHLVEEL